MSRSSIFENIKTRNFSIRWIAYNKSSCRVEDLKYNIKVSKLKEERITGFIGRYLKVVNYLHNLFIIISYRIIISWLYYSYIFQPKNANIANSVPIHKESDRIYFKVATLYFNCQLLYNYTAMHMEIAVKYSWEEKNYQFSIITFCCIGYLQFL